jgi:hypothetical protein
VIRVPRVFEDTRKETHLSLISTHPMWILAVGFSRCDNNFSVVCELQKWKKIVLYFSSNLYFLRIQRTLSNIVRQNRRKLPNKFPKCRENWPNQIFKSGESPSRSFPEQVGCATRSRGPWIVIALSIRISNRYIETRYRSIDSFETQIRKIKPEAIWCTIKWCHFYTINFMVDFL